VAGAVTGLVVAAAIVGQSALASNGASSRHAAAKPTAKAAAAAAPNPFVAVVAQAVQAGTINAAQGRVLDAHILAGSIDPGALVAAGVLSAAQMQTVNDRLVAVKKGLAAQAHAGAVTQKPAAPAAVSCPAAGSGPGKAAG
jgi:uncharacterized surface protein with fasciclin (FAS1) repeats